MKRREFITRMAALAGAGLLADKLASGREPKEIPKRPFGKTGIQLSIIGLGGVTVMKTPQREVNRIVHEAVDRGVNYIDVAPTYGDAEELLGVALKGYRERVFLACKTLKRNKGEAAEELRRSLKRLQTDHIDLYQFHAISSMEDVEAIFGLGGALEAFLEAREKGLIRFIGFSAHSVKAALAAMDRFDFDSILFPINFVLYFKEGFGPQVVKKAEEKGIVRLAIKAMAKGRWPEGADKSRFPKCWYEPVSDTKLASMALRFTLSQPVTAAVPPGDVKLFRMAMEIASSYEPITDEEVEELKRIAQNQTPIFKLDV